MGPLSSAKPTYSWCVPSRQSLLFQPVLQPAETPPIRLTLFTLLSPHSVSVVVDDSECPAIHTFPNAALFPHLSTPPGDPVLLPHTTPQSLKLVNNTDEFLAWQPHSSLAHRLWDTALHGEPPTQHLARALSDFHIFNQTETQRVVLAHHTLPVPYPEDSAAYERTFFAPFDVVACPPDENPRDMLVIAESKHAVWLEDLGEHGLALKICSFPTDEMRARRETPQWYTERLVRTLEIPDGLDLRLVCDLALCEAQGIVITSLTDRSIWVLQY